MKASAEDRTEDTHVTKSAWVQNSNKESWTNKAYMLSQGGSRLGNVPVLSSSNEAMVVEKARVLCARLVKGREDNAPTCPCPLSFCLMHKHHTVPLTIMSQIQLSSVCLWWCLFSACKCVRVVVGVGAACQVPCHNVSMVGI